MFKYNVVKQANDRFTVEFYTYSERLKKKALMYSATNLSRQDVRDMLKGRVPESEVQDYIIFH